MLVLILYISTNNYAIALLRFDWIKRIFLSFLFSSDIMMRDKGDERFALSVKRNYWIFLHLHKSYSKFFLNPNTYLLLFYAQKCMYLHRNKFSQQHSSYHIGQNALVEASCNISFFLANLFLVRKERKRQRQRKRKMLLLRSVVVVVVIPFITQYITGERKNNNVGRTVIQFFSSLQHTNHFCVVVEFASSITGQEKIIYLSSTNDNHDQYYIYHLFAFICEKDSRISSAFISLFLSESKKRR